MKIVQFSLLKNDLDVDLFCTPKIYQTFDQTRFFNFINELNWEPDRIHNTEDSIIAYFFGSKLTLNGAHERHITIMFDTEGSAISMVDKITENIITINIEHNTNVQYIQELMKNFLI